MQREPLTPERTAALCSNILILAGTASIATGAYWVFPAVGLIVAGMAAIALALLIHPEPPEHDE